MSFFNELKDDEDDEDDDEDEDDDIHLQIPTLDKEPSNFFQDDDGGSDDENDDDDIDEPVEKFSIRVDYEKIYNSNSDSPAKDKEITEKSESLLSQVEEKKARDAFRKCCGDTKRLNREQFSDALAILGQVCDDNRIKDLYDANTKKDALTEDIFLEVLGQLRDDSDTAEVNAQIKEAFMSLINGTCDNPSSQIDPASNQPFLLVKQLRQVLTTEAEKLSDEEADELIRECRPIPSKDFPNDIREACIFLDQYKSMLLDAGIEVYNRA